MENKKRLIAISTKGKKVAIVKSVQEDEYKKLLDEQQKELDSDERVKRSDSQYILSIDNRVTGLERKIVYIAKAIYDNYVIRGLFEENEDFEKAWYDYFFNGCEIQIEKAPQEFVDIVRKVGANNEK